MRTISLVVTWLLATACGERAPTTDSLAVWSLSATPRISVGVAQGDERFMFRRVVGALMLPDGGVLVADVDPSLTIVDSTGKFVRRFGREGDGPGEFRMLWGAPFRYRGDSIAAWDIGLQRVSVFGPDGTFARAATVSVPKRFWAPGTIPDQSCCDMIAALSNGAFVLEFPSVIPNEPGPNRYSRMTLTALASDGATGDTIGTFESTLYRHDPNAPNGIRDVRLSSPFAYAVAGDTTFGGNGHDAVVVRTVPGARPDTIRLPIERTPVTPALREAYADAWRAEYKRNPRIFEGPPEDLFEGEYTTHLPTFTQLYHDGGGALWLPQWRLPFSTDSVRVLVYSVTGRPLGTIALPPRAWIVDLRPDRVALLMRDSLDVESVRVYDVIRRGSGAAPKGL